MQATHYNPRLKEIMTMSDLIQGDPWLGLTHHNPELQTGAEYSAGLYPGSPRLGSFAQHHNLQLMKIALTRYKHL